MCLIATTSATSAYAIQVYQDVTPEEREYLDLVGKLREAGIFISYTVGKGIIYLNGIPDAYGEVEDKVTVPFDFANKDCAPSLTGTYLCEWHPKTGNGDGNGTNKTVYDWPKNQTDTTNTNSTNTVETQENKSDLENQIDDVLKPFKIDLNRLTNNPPSMPDKKEYLELLKYLATCQRGTQEAAAIQQKDRFAVSTTWINDGEAWLKSLHYKGNYGTLKKAIEECIAQHTILQPVILGRQYLDLSPYADEKPIYHSDFVTTNATYPKPVLNAHDFVKTVETAQNTLCASSNIDHDTKLHYGCFKNNEVDVGGVIHYQSEVYHKYEMYKNYRADTPNVSIVVKKHATGPIEEFIIQHGGYDRAIEAIKWKQHFDETDVNKMSEPWNK